MKKAKYIGMRHLSGLPEWEEGRIIGVEVYEDKLQFNTKQILPLSRIKGCEIDMDTIFIERHPIQRALLFGLISAVLVTNLFGFLTGKGDGEVLFFVFGSIGAIIGAISGVRPQKQNVAVLSINHKNIEGEYSIIRLAEKSKNSRKLIIDIADTLNNAVGYTPLKRTEQMTAKHYEI